MVKYVEIKITTVKLNVSLLNVISVKQLEEMASRMIRRCGSISFGWTVVVFLVPYLSFSVGQIISDRSASNFHREAQGRVEHVSDHDLLPQHNRCQAITISLCNNMPYNVTIMPNILGHHNQEEAGMEVHQFFPLVKVNCSKDLHFFLCSVYIPVCTILDMPIPPCRPLCMSAKHGCERLMNRFGFHWPESLECSKFPEGPHEKMCVGQNNSAHDRNIAGGISNTNSDWVNNWQDPTRVISGGGRHWSNNNNPSKDTSGIGGMPFECPLHFLVPKRKKYSLVIGGKLTENCGAPCHGMFFDADQIAFSRAWVGGWAIICLVSCTFTISSFLVNMRRFRYPERPVIFISMCYWFIGLTYLLGLVLGDHIPCDKPLEPPNFMTGQQMASTITQGVGKEVCTIAFMSLYFFMMAASIWWVVLTITWFLAAGLKWSHEALENNSAWFHVAAWAIPAVKTIVILATENIEGCYINHCFIYSVAQLKKNYLNYGYCLLLCFLYLLYIIL